MFRFRSAVLLREHEPKLVGGIGGFGIGFDGLAQKFLRRRQIIQLCIDLARAKQRAGVIRANRQHSLVILQGRLPALSLVVNLAQRVERLPVVRRPASDLFQIGDGLVGIARPIKRRAQFEIVPAGWCVVLPGEWQRQFCAAPRTHRFQIRVQHFRRRNFGVDFVSAAAVIDEHEKWQLEIRAQLEQISAEDGILSREIG